MRDQKKTTRVSFLDIPLVIVASRMDEADQKAIGNANKILKEYENNSKRFLDKVQEQEPGLSLAEVKEALFEMTTADYGYGNKKLGWFIGNSVNEYQDLIYLQLETGKYTFTQISKLSPEERIKLLLISHQSSEECVSACTCTC